MNTAIDLVNAVMNFVSLLERNKVIDYPVVRTINRFLHLEH